jgi:transcriptional regulator with XRE-family HTH domain
MEVPFPNCTNSPRSDHFYRVILDAIFTQLSVDKICQQNNVGCVSVVGQRLKCVRQAKGLSLREFAKELNEDHTVLGRIEQGERYPPKSRRKRFAHVLSLTLKQLDALISVERRGLNPYEFLPEIPPAHIAVATIEKEADGVLEKYRRAVNRSAVEIPVAIEDVLRRSCGLHTEYADFETKKVPVRDPQRLCGCVYPDGFDGKDRLILVNTGHVGGCTRSRDDMRVTAAHEGGHFILHGGNKDSKQLFFRFKKEPTFCREIGCEETPRNPLEYQASVFAACLLMPKTHFLAEWQRFAGSVPRLAEAFGVPEEFAAFRAKMLDCE